MRTTSYSRDQLRNDYFNCDNLKDLIKALETDFQARGEVVCQFVLNGMSLHEEDEARLQEIRCEEIEALEVRSEKPAALLLDVLRNWELEIPSIITKTDELAGNLRLKGPEGRYTAFVQLIDSCQFLVESLASMDSVVDTTQFLSREQWQKCEKQMIEAIGQGLTAFEKKDFVMLADVLEYDLANSLQSWFDLLKGLNQCLLEENERDSRTLSDRIFKKAGGPRADTVDLPATAQLCGTTSK